MSSPLSTKALLIAAATRLLDESGIEALTLRAVAQAVGVSHNAPYKHFADKRALLAAVTEASFSEMTVAFGQIAADAATPGEALRSVIGAYLSFARRLPARYRLLFSDPEIGRMGGMLEAQALKTFDAVEGLVRAAQQCGELAQGDPVRMTALIYGAAHGLADLELSGRTRPSKGMDDVDALMALLLDRLALPGGAS